VPTIAQTLNLREQPGETIEATLVDHLREKELLLVLDNLEQVVECAPAIAALLAAARELRVLATSREPLHVASEREYPLSPLPAQDAVALFGERARAARPGVAVDEAIALEICRRVDHLPLAIELAAARTKLLPPAALLQRLHERLKLLTAGARDVDERQRTLRATIDWSHDLLSDDEQLLFRRLAVFAGGWTLEAAEEVCAAEGELDVLEGLGSLVDKSLVRQHELDGQPRFTMLETIREYAAEALAAAGEGEAIGSRHTRWCVALADRAEPELRGREQRRFADLVGSEYGNVRAALARSLDRAGDTDALRLAASLWFFWYLRGYYDEGRHFLQRALAAEPAAEVRVRAKALLGLGALSSEQGRHEEGEALAREALSSFRQCSDERETAYALIQVATNTALRGDVTSARGLLHESLSLLGDRDRWSAGVARWWLGWVALSEGDYEESAAHFAECVALYRELGEPGGTGYALFGVGAALLGAGRSEGARERFVEARELAHELDFAGLAISCVGGIAAVAAASGDVERTPPLLAAAEAERRRVGAPRDRPLRDLEQRARAAALAVLGEERFQALEREAPPFEDAVSEALAPSRRTAGTA